MKKLLLSALLLASTTAGATEGFGIKLGGSIEGLKAEPVDESYSFLMHVQPPKKHPLFKRYVIIYTEKFGVCRIIGETNPQDDNSFGNGVKNDYKKFKKLLSKKYTFDKEYDFLMAGSIWKDSDDFLMGLYKEERFLTSFFKNGEDTISVEAVGLSRSRSKTRIVYGASFVDECLEEAKKEQNAVF